MTRSPLQQTLGLIGWLVLTFSAAGLGALASAQAGTFYGQLARPVWAPPGWLFGPVWTLLYFLMAIAVWLVWRRTPYSVSSRAIMIYLIQLAANALWTWLFFVWKLGAWSFVEVIALWGLIALCMASFWRLNRVAAFLLLPYLAWVSFASALTWTIWHLNPAILG